VGPDGEGAGAPASPGVAAGSAADSAAAAGLATAAGDFGGGVGAK